MQETLQDILSPGSKAMEQLLSQVQEMQLQLQFHWLPEVISYRPRTRATNCKSPITNFIINDTHANPVVTLLSSLDNTHCTGMAPNGLMTIQINGGAPVGDFTIEWFEGNGTSTPLGTTVGSYRRP